MQGFEILLKRLIEFKVEFVIVGGFSATLHGCSMVTDDLDIDGLIISKRAMDRPRDREAIVQLEAIRERLELRRK